jgi:uncharacterized protein
MLGEHHDINHEFPEYHELITALKGRDPEFAALMKEHDELDNQIRDLEEKGQPVADDYIESLKKERVLLKDKVYVRLRNY